MRLDLKPCALPSMRAMKKRLAYADKANDAEIVNVRLVSIGVVDKTVLEFAPKAESDSRVGTRQTWFDGWTDTGIYDRAQMPIGLVLAGPAIIEEAGGTSVVPPGWSVKVDASGALICTAESVN